MTVMVKADIPMFVTVNKTGLRRGLVSLMKGTCFGLKTKTTAPSFYA